jgi:hypothetical protein
MIVSLASLCLGQPEWEQRCEQLRSASTLSAMVWIALQMGLWIARQLLEQELEHRAHLSIAWEPCPQCGTQLHSKGWQARQMQTLVGQIG